MSYANNLDFVRSDLGSNCFDTLGSIPERFFLI